MTIHSVFDIPGFLPLMERLNGKPLQDLRKSTNAGIVIQLGEHCLTITPGIHPDDGLPCKAILHSCSSSYKQIAPAESFSLLSSSLAGETLVNVTDEPADGIGFYFRSSQNSFIDHVLITPQMDSNGLPSIAVSLSFSLFSEVSQ